MKARKIKKEIDETKSNPAAAAIEIKTDDSIDVKDTKIEERPQNSKVKLELDEASIKTAIEGQKKKGTSRKRVKREREIDNEEEEEEENQMNRMKKNKLEAVRTMGRMSKKLLGAHVSAQGGPENAIKNAINIGCQAFALFIRNQRRWESKPMEENAVERWNKAIKSAGFPLDRIVPHGSYLMNPGSPDPAKLEMSRKAMLDECQRCERLGIVLYNFHPGSTTGTGTKEECLTRIAESINFIQDRTEFITLVVETMCGSGNTVGDKFEHMRSIIDQVRNKNRIGVCIDTCHTFAAGYNIAQKDAYEKVMEEFDKVVGFNYLKAIHLNDSKGKLSSNLDRHCNIGKGHLGDAAFRLLMRDPRLDGIPMILETPVPSNDDGIYTEEMYKLYQFEKEAGN